MKPVATNQYSVKAQCPDCGVLSVFDYKASEREFGALITSGQHQFGNKTWHRSLWRLLRCSNCGRGGLAKFYDQNGPPTALEVFYPRAIERANIPKDVPEGVVSEYREAELCASVEAWRAASALLRSALEKVLKTNGYIKGTLQAKIDAAADDGVITAARKQRAHEDVRVLGNEVVHDEYRPVSEDEVQSALHYVQRVLEDLYDDRSTVETLLVKKNRLAPGI